MSRILDIDTKYKIVIVILIAIFLLVILAALVGNKVKDLFKASTPVAIIVNEGDLVVDYIDGQKIDFLDNNPREYKVTLTNNSSEKIYYSLYLNDINVTNVIVKVFDYDDNLVESVTTSDKSTKLLNLVEINGNETVRYVIKIETDTLINFKGNLKVVNESLSNSSFDDLILLNNDVVSPKSRVGNEIATVNEGLISTSDNKGTSYYFRGSIDNNYVKLGDLIFRIVRINGDGSVIHIIIRKSLMLSY